MTNLRQLSDTDFCSLMKVVADYDYFLAADIEHLTSVSQIPADKWDEFVKFYNECQGIIKYNEQTGEIVLTEDPENIQILYPTKKRYIIFTFVSIYLLFASIYSSNEVADHLIWVASSLLLIVRNVSCLVPYLTWTKITNKGVSYKSFGTAYRTKTIPLQCIDRFTINNKGRSKRYFVRWFFKVSIVEIRYKESYMTLVQSLMPCKGLFNIYGKDVLPHCGDANRAVRILNYQLLKFKNGKNPPI